MLEEESMLAGGHDRKPRCTSHGYYNLVALQDAGFEDACSLLVSRVGCWGCCRYRDWVYP
jgi:hypothetical protein